MPGIVGIISPNPAAECHRLVELMTGTLKHEPFYTSGAILFPGLGVYVGWVGMEGAPMPPMVSDANQEIILILSGECYGDSTPNSPAPGGSLLQWILALYEQEGPQFVAQLNGLFSGVLIDKRRRQALLFNDRYGVNRIYYVETPAGLFFASEIKAILRARPEFRAFDEIGVAEFLSLGCCVEGRTLFRNVSLLPSASLWTFADGQCSKEKYFSPEIWESQPLLSKEEFEVQFQETFRNILPRYFSGETKLGISLTGGLDTRMIMACRPESHRPPVCYTYSGQSVETLDARLARRIAAAAGLEYQALSLGPDFFSDFASHADRTVYITDGCSGLTGAHEIYMSRPARQLSSIRITGNYGGEVFRGVSTFKPNALADGLLSAEVTSKSSAATRRWADWKEHQITFAAFREVPWNLSGNLMAGRSQLSFRTPYLDNQMVALAYRVPEAIRRSRHAAVRLVRENDPILARIPTDKAHLGDFSALGRAVRRAFAEVTCKVDYLYSDGLPSGLSPLEPFLRTVASGTGLLGLHKHLQYRSWFRRELADYIRGRLADAKARQYQFWEPRLLARLAEDHIRGRKNYVAEINAVLTLDAVQRLLLEGS